MSKWRVGTNRPSAEKLAQMLELRAGLEKAVPPSSAQATPGSIQEAPDTEKAQMPSSKPGSSQAPKPPGDIVSPQPPIYIIVKNSGAIGASGQSPMTEAPPSCAKCPLEGRPRVGGRGGAEGCVMLVGEGPGETDAKDGRAFSGLNGKRLEKLLRLATSRNGACLGLWEYQTSRFRPLRFPLFGLAPRRETDASQIGMPLARPPAYSCCLCRGKQNERAVLGAWGL